MGNPLSGENAPIWKPADDRKFSLKTWKRLNKTDIDSWPWLDNFWHSSMPTRLGSSCWKFSWVFLWKVLNKGHPVDENFRRIVISVVSCCCCCPHPQLENLGHLLLHSHLANEVWTHLCKKIQVRPNILLEAVAVVPTWSLLLVSVGETCMIGFWSIWTNRNSIQHGETCMNTESVLLKIQKMTAKDAQIFYLKKQDSAMEKHLLEIMNIRGSLLLWK